MHQLLISSSDNKFVCRLIDFLDGETIEPNSTTLRVGECDNWEDIFSMFSSEKGLASET